MGEITDSKSGGAVIGEPPRISDHELLRRIGGGSYGEVWLARSVLGELRAVKIIRCSRFNDARPFEREFEGIQRFEPISRSHPSQLAILHVGKNDEAGYFYYVMELADDAGWRASSRAVESEDQGSSGALPSLKENAYAPRTLRHELEQHGRLPIPDCIQIGLSLTTALAHLHQHGLVHRDIKPSNVIFVNGVAKLGDIGLVTEAGDTQSIVGTEGYLAPEGPGTPQADIFSLGKLLYEISTGLDRRRFAELPEDLRAWPDRAAVVEFNEIVLKACAKDPARRYQSAEEMNADFALLQRGKSVKKRRAVERGWSWTWKAAVVVSLVGLAALFLRNELTRTKTSTENGTADSFENSGTKDREAYALFRQGKTSLDAGPIGSQIKSIDYFYQALARDPKFALALAYKAQAYGRLAERQQRPPKDCQPQAIQAATAALAIDDTLQPALHALAWSKAYFEWDWDQAERLLLRALKLKPQDAGAHMNYAFFLALMGRHREASEHGLFALTADPGNAVMRGDFAVCLYYAQQNERAVELLRQAISLNPNLPIPHYKLYEVLWTMGKHEEALQEWERWGTLNKDKRVSFQEEYEAYRDGGTEGHFRLLLANLEKRKPASYWVAPMDWVEAYTGLGDLDHAFAWLDKVCDERQPELVTITVNPHYSALWPDPRFKAVLKRMGLENRFPQHGQGASARVP